MHEHTISQKQANVISLDPKDPSVCPSRCPFMYEHWHCGGCGSPIAWADADGDLPDNATRCTQGHVIHRSCECIVPELIADPVAAMKRVADPFEAGAVAVYISAGRMLADDIAECRSVADLQEGKKTLLEARDRIDERVREIGARIVSLMTEPLRVGV